jgi:hypothetical protein
MRRCLVPSQKITNDGALERLDRARLMFPSNPCLDNAINDLWKGMLETTVSAEVLYGAEMYSDIAGGARCAGRIGKAPPYIHLGEVVTFRTTVESN